jgi:CubicO group peptidase (beta-lactamase class C family)
MVATAVALSLLVPLRLHAQAALGATRKPQVTPGACTANTCFAWLDSLFAAAVASHAVRAASVVLVRADTVLALRGYGATNGAGGPVDPSRTVFHAASVSKVVAPIVLAKQALAGSLLLDDDQRTRLSVHDALGDARGPLTAHHLLQHTAFIESRFLGALAPPGVTADLAAYFAAQPPQRTHHSGDDIAYSNIGAALAARLAEVVGNARFDSLATRDVFAPLGMTSTSFAQPIPRAISDRMPEARRSGAPTILPYAAGAMLTTASDMGRLLRALVNNGNVDGTRVMDPRIVDSLLRPRWRAHPQMPGTTDGLFESFTPRGRALFLTGDGGHHSLLWLLPAHRLGLFLVADANDTDGAELREKVVNALLVHEPSAAAPVAEVPPLAVESPAANTVAVPDARTYAGVYRSAQAVRTTFEKIASLPMEAHISVNPDGSLRARPFGGGFEVHLVQTAPSLFRGDDSAYYAFRVNADGRAVSMTTAGGISDPGSFLRIAWYEHAAVHLAAAASCVVAFLAVVARAMWRRLRRRTPLPSTRALNTWALATALLALSAPLASATSVLLQSPPYYAIPWPAYVGIGLLNLSALCALILLVLRPHASHAPCATHSPCRHSIPSRVHARPHWSLDYSPTGACSSHSSRPPAVLSQWSVSSVSRLPSSVRSKPTALPSPPRSTFRSRDERLPYSVLIRAIATLQ